MSHLSLLSGAHISSGTLLALRESGCFQSESPLRERRGALGIGGEGFLAQAREEDCALPSGVASMEHWLDLNA